MTLREPVSRRPRSQAHSYSSRTRATPGLGGAAGREGARRPERGLEARVGLGPIPRQPQPTPNAQSPPPRRTYPPESHPREAGARRGEGAPGVAPTACRGDPGPALEVRVRRPGRGGAPGLEAPAEPLSGPRWAHPGPRGRAGPPQPAAVEGDECGQPPRARAATHRPRAARRPPPGATAPPGRGVTAVSAARCASPPTGPPAGSRPLLLF